MIVHFKRNNSHYFEREEPFWLNTRLTQTDKVPVSLCERHMMLKKCYCVKFITTVFFPVIVAKAVENPVRARRQNNPFFNQGDNYNPYRLPPYPNMAAPRPFVDSFGTGFDVNPGTVDVSGNLMFPREDGSIWDMHMQNSFQAPITSWRHKQDFGTSTPDAATNEATEKAYENYLNNWNPSDPSNQALGPPSPRTFLGGVDPFNNFGSIHGLVDPGTAIERNAFDIPTDEIGPDGEHERFRYTGHHLVKPLPGITYDHDHTLDGVDPLGWDWNKHFSTFLTKFVESNTESANESSA